MQGFKKYVVTVSLSAAIVLCAAANGLPTTHRSHRAGAADDNIITVILDLIQLASRISIPPG